MAHHRFRGLVPGVGRRQFLSFSGVRSTRHRYCWALPGSCRLKFPVGICTWRDTLNAHYCISVRKYRGTSAVNSHFPEPLHQRLFGSRQISVRACSLYVLTSTRHACQRWNTHHHGHKVGFRTPKIPSCGAHSVFCAAAVKLLSTYKVHGTWLGAVVPDITLHSVVSSKSQTRNICGCGALSLSYRMFSAASSQPRFWSQTTGYRLEQSCNPGGLESRVLPRSHQLKTVDPLSSAFSSLQRLHVQGVSIQPAKLEGPRGKNS